MSAAMTGTVTSEEVVSADKLQGPDPASVTHCVCDLRPCLSLRGPHFSHLKIGRRIEIMEVRPWRGP